MPVAEPAGPRKVVVLEGLETHDSAAAERAVRRADARIIHPPPYSSDYDPIEELRLKLNNTSVEPPHGVKKTSIRLRPSLPIVRRPMVLRVGPDAPDWLHPERKRR
jgi:hypothetical protein